MIFLSKVFSALFIPAYYTPQSIHIYLSKRPFLQIFSLCSSFYTVYFTFLCLLALSCFSRFFSFAPYPNCDPCQAPPFFPRKYVIEGAAAGPLDIKRP
jgi:hypothetical protein